jgi:hypothetical protein
VLISFKKSVLDLQTMAAENNRHDSRTPAMPIERKAPPSIVEIAEQNKRERTGKAKNLSLEEIDTKSSVSIVGSDSAEPSMHSRETESLSEREWQSRLWALKKEVNRLREKTIAAESSCEDSKRKQYVERTTPSQKPVELMSTYKESSQCRRLAEIRAQLQEAETRWENAREEARRAGVSWQNLE